MFHPVQITVKECHNEEAQCAFVIDKIIELTNDGSTPCCSHGDIAILYRRQVSPFVFLNDMLSELRMLKVLKKFTFCVGKAPQRMY